MAPPFMNEDFNKFSQLTYPVFGNTGMRWIGFNDGFCGHGDEILVSLKTSFLVRDLRFSWQ
jgi:hypothetical protein